MADIILGPLSPRMSLSIQCLFKLGYWPDLRSPASFNEKIQIRKLRTSDHPLLAILSDKIKVKSHVAQVIGEKYVIPTLWGGKFFPEVIPPDWQIPFIIKSNRGSGLNYLVKSKNDFNKDKIINIISRWNKLEWPHRLHEKWYNDIEQMILVEPMIGTNPIDYKFFVFNGKVEFVQIDTDRFTRHKRAFFDRNWIRQPFTLKYPMEKNTIPRPRHFDEMIAIAERLGTGWSFVRIDLYDLHDGPRFGEMTFTPGAGLEKFDPPEYDRRLGALWEIGQSR